MAQFERESKVKIPELKLGETLVANYASLIQEINDDSGSEVIIAERAEILWGQTKETLIARTEKLIQIAQIRAASAQAEIAKAQEIKEDLIATAEVAEEPIKP